MTENSWNFHTVLQIPTLFFFSFWKPQCNVRPKLISRKIWMTEKSCNFHTLQLYWVDFTEICTPWMNLDSGIISQKIYEIRFHEKLQSLETLFYPFSVSKWKGCIFRSSFVLYVCWMWKSFWIKISYTLDFWQAVSRNISNFCENLYLPELYFKKMAITKGETLDS